MATLEREQASAVVESSDSLLGRWTVGRWSPPPSSPLSNVVEHIWYFDGRLARAKERVFPDGTAELVVMLDEVHRDGDADSPAPFPSVCINGLRSRAAVVVAPDSRCRVLGIRLTPLGACMLLRESIAGLLDVTIDLQDALGTAAAELGERCADAAATSFWNAERNAHAVLKIATRWMLQRVVADGTVDPAIHYVLDEITGARGVVSLGAIGSELGIPRSILANRFRRQLGVTPKRFARIVRFREALSILGSRGSVSRAATEVGYYDQAHMYRDFEEFAGMTPRAFLVANRYPGSPSLAED